MRTALKNSIAFFLIIAVVMSQSSCSKDSNAINQPPVANAGKKDTVSLNVDAILDGSASYDPDGKIIKYQWEKYITPGDFTIQDPHSALTKVSGLKAGEYRFKLTVTDDRGAAASAVKLVLVNDYTVGNNTIIFNNLNWAIDNVNNLFYLKTPDMPGGYPVSSISAVYLSSTLPGIPPWLPVAKDGTNPGVFYYRIENNKVVAYIYFGANYDYISWLIQYFGEKVMVEF